jgi:hypothetical protein
MLEDDRDRFHDLVKLTPLRSSGGRSAARCTLLLDRVLAMNIFPHR